MATRRLHDACRMPILLFPCAFAPHWTPESYRQANQEPFLDTFSMALQDELDHRRSRLMERRFQVSGLDERATLGDFDWRFNPKLPRQACFELHTLKFIGEAQNGLIIGKPGTDKSHIAKAVAYQAT